MGSMIHAHILPDSPILLQYSEAKAASQRDEDKNAAQIDIATLLHGGGNHRPLVEFIHLIRMVVPGWSGVGVGNCP